MADAKVFDAIQHPKKRAYLRALVEAGGNVTKACEIAEIDRSTPYTSQWAEDEEFAGLLPLAETMAADHLEAEAVRRAYHGVTEPVGFYKGAPSAYVQRYSDTLLIFLLKGAKPEKYADRHQVTGKDGGPIEVNTRDVRERFAGRIAGIAARIGPNGGDPAPNGNGAAGA
jgi:hypothetical protein